MKTALKLLALLTSLVFISIVAVVLYVMNWEPDNHKEWLAEIFYEATGHNISFAGELELTIYPWLSLELNQVEISNATGFTDPNILSSEQARVRIKLMPMLKGQYEIDTVLLQNTSIHLEVNSSGQNNWSGLFENTATEETAQTTSTNSETVISNLFLGGINIQGASLTYSNAVDSQQFSINNFNMSTGELIYGQPVEISLNFDSHINKPELDTQTSLVSTILYDTDNQRYQLAPLVLTSTVMSSNIPDGSANINLETALELNLTTGTLSIPALSLNTLGAQLDANITASKLLTEAPTLQADFTLNGNDLALFFQIAEIESLAQQINKLGNNSFDVSAAVNIDTENGNLILNSIDANLLGANIAGNINARNINSQNPGITGKLNANGPDLPTLLEVIGQVQGGSNAALAQFGEKLSGIDTKTFNFSADFDADLESGNISIPTLEIDALGLNAKGFLSTENIQNTSGTINGELSVDTENLDQLMTAIEQDALGDILQSLTMKLKISGSRNNIHLNPLELNLMFSGDQIPNSPASVDINANTQINLDEETLNINSFSLSGFNLSSSGNLEIISLFTEPVISGQLQFVPFNLRQLLIQLKQPLASMADPSTLEKVSFNSSFTASNAHLELDEFNLGIDDTNITGSYQINNFDTLASEFTLHIDQLNADRYLISESTVSNQNENDDNLFFNQFNKLELKGRLNIDQLSISNMDLNDILIEINASNGQLFLAPIAANLYQGNYNGTISLNTASPTPFIDIESIIKNVALGPLLQDFVGDSYVSGNGNINLSLNGAGESINAMKASLNGNGNVELTDGIFKGVDVPSTLAQIETMLESHQYGQLQRGEQTPFDGFYSSLTIDDGIVSSEDLLIVAPGFEVKGRGTLVNLNNDTINFDLVTSVDLTTATRNDEEYDLGGYELPIACSGTVYSPSCLPDTDEILQQALSNTVERKLGDFLQRTLGVEEMASEPSPTNNNEKPATQLQDPEPEDEPVDLRQQLINRALERLSR